MQVKKQQLEMDMEQQTSSKSGKEYVKAIDCVDHKKLWKILKKMEPAYKLMLPGDNILPWSTTFPVWN